MFLSSEDNMEDTEAVTLRCSVKRVLLKISQNSQENAWEHLFYRTLPVASSASSMLNVLFTVL